VRACCNGAGVRACGTLRRVALRLALASLGLVVAACGSDPRSGIRLVYRFAPDATLQPTHPDDVRAGAALVGARLRALEVVRRRLEHVDDTSVTSRGDEIVVEVVGKDAAQLAELEASLQRRAALALQAVDPDAGFFECVLNHARVDHPYRIEVITDAWPQPRPHHGVDLGDRYLAGPRAELVRYLDRLANLDPACAAPPDREVRFEKIAPLPPRSSILRPEDRWRTEVLERTPWITGSSVESAVAKPDDTDRWTVDVELDVAGAEKFGRLTRDHVGDKLAIVLDDEITSSPVIRDAIPGGRITVTMGGEGPTREPAIELAAALSAGSLPGRLIVESKSAFEIEGDDGRWIALGVLGLGGVALAIFAMVRRR